ncbi:hypothetical protein EVAR_103017_1 [Eumeta japonica]|uniref:Uncharacterized protein n=1 Tax=Eumeta variegata TaxID=151549 RepID=A0A4C1WDW4_EUMVA|nr:hypothetical protein EVAR_103017_1 [Eumeta japonica]
MTRDLSSVILLPPTFSSIKVTVELLSRSAERVDFYRSFGAIHLYRNNCQNSRIVLTLLTDIAACSVTTAVVCPHVHLSCSVLGGVAYDVHLDMTYRDLLYT